MTYDGRAAASHLADWLTTADLGNDAVGRRNAVASFVDTLGCMFAGSGEPVVRDAVRLVAGWGAGGATVFGGGIELPAPWAAFVNGTAAHVLDFDDYETAASTHPGAVLVPAILALAQERGKTGADAIDAYIAGFEVIARVGEAVGYGHYRAGWHSTSTIGPIGAAAACARLIGLDAARAMAALSMATSMAGGYKLQFGTDTKPLHAGLAAKAGVMAACLAQSGITADAGALESDAGFLGLHGDGSAAGFEGPLGKPGRKLAISEFGVNRKPYPCCAYSHRAIAGAIDLMERHGASAENISGILVRMPAPFAEVVNKRNPESPSEARFSLSYCLAAAIRRGALVPDDFTEPAMTDRRISDLEARVLLEPYPVSREISDLSPELPDTVLFRLREGGEISTEIAEVRGGGGHPLSDSELADKFRGCARSCMSEAAAEKVLAALWELDRPDSVQKILVA